VTARAADEGGVGGRDHPGENDEYALRRRSPALGRTGTSAGFFGNDWEDRVTRQVRALATLMSLSLLLGVGCGGDDDDAEPVRDLDTTTTGDASDTTADDTADTTVPPDTPEAAAIAAYEQGWASLFEAAANPPNPMHPALRESFTERAADTMVGIVVGLQDAGHYAVGEMETHPVVVNATDQVVTLRDCTIERSITYEVGTDAIVEDEPNPPGLPRLVEVTNQDGTWRVSLIDTPEGTCTPE
jgi:hypothetical protein